MTLEWIPAPMTVCQLKSIAGVDIDRPWTFISRTDSELSLCCPTADAPDDTLSREDGWRMFRVAGRMPFTLTGVMARLSGALARASVPLYALSTYDSDYIMVKADQAARAEAALIADGHTWLGRVTGTV